MALTLLLLLSLAAAGLTAPISAVPQHPLILIPGLTSANLTLYSSPIPTCPPAANWNLWPSPNLTSAADVTCYELAMTTNYNPLTRTVNSTLGFNVAVPSWLQFDASSLGPYIVGYWQSVGYVVNQTLFSASFDWRFPSIGQASYYRNMQSLVEYAYALNHNTTVDLLAVSYGPQVALGFLHRMSASWKAKYIRWFIADSPLWSGAPMAVAAVAAGLPPEDGRLFIRLIAAGVHASLWIFPRPGTSNTTWSDSEVIVSTPSRAYVASNLSALLEDLGFGPRASSLAAIRDEPDLNDFAAPGVNTFVTYGTLLNTTASVRFAQDFVRNKTVLPALPEFINDPAGGDGLVPLRSSHRSLYAWPAAQKAQGLMFLSKGFANQSHATCCGKFDQYSTPCFNDVVALLTLGTIPSGLDPGSVH